MLPIPRMAESSSNNSNAPYSLREPIEQAAGRMSGHVRRTALESSSWLADLAGDNTHVALKLGKPIFIGFDGFRSTLALPRTLIYFRAVFIKTLSNELILGHSTGQ